MGRILPEDLVDEDREHGGCDSDGGVPIVLSRKCIEFIARDVHGDQ